MTPLNEIIRLKIWNSLCCCEEHRHSLKMKVKSQGHKFWHIWNILNIKTLGPIEVKLWPMFKFVAKYLFIFKSRSKVKVIHFGTFEMLCHRVWNIKTLGQEVKILWPFNVKVCCTMLLFSKVKVKCQRSCIHLKYLKRPSLPDISIKRLNQHFKS